MPGVSTCGDKGENMKIGHIGILEGWNLEYFIVSGSESMPDAMRHYLLYKKENIIQCCNCRSTSLLNIIAWLDNPRPANIIVTGVAWICCACCPPLIPNCFHSYGLQIPSAASIYTKGDWESFFPSASISSLPAIPPWLAAHFNVTLFPAVRVLRLYSKTHTNLDLIWDDAKTFEVVWLSEKTSILARLSSKILSDS